MPRQLTLSRISPQSLGLTGRRLRSTFTRQRADRPIFSSELPTAPQAPEVEVPIESGPFSGSEGTVRQPPENTFGGTLGERLAMKNSEPGRLFGLPALKGAKTLASAIALNAPFDEALGMATASTVAPGVFNVFNRGIPSALSQRKAAPRIDAALSDIDPQTAEIMGESALSRVNEEENPNFISKMFASPEQFDVRSILEQQRKDPKTLPSLAFFKLIEALKGDKGTTTTEADLVGDVGGQSGGFDFTGASGVNPNVSGDTGSFDFTGASGVNPNEDFGDTGGFDFEGGNPNPPGLADGDEGSDEGTVLCTVLFRLGIMPEPIYNADVAYASTLNINIMRGYHFWAQPVAKLMQKSSLLVSVLKGPVLSWAKHMAFYGSGGRVGKPTIFGNVCETVGLPICRFIGKVVRT